MRRVLCLGTLLWLLAGPAAAAVRALPEDRSSASDATQVQADCSATLLLKNRCVRTCAACVTAAPQQARLLVDFVVQESPSTPARRFTNEVPVPDIAPPRRAAA